MPSIIRTPKRGRQAVHAMHVGGHFVADTCCGIKGGGWEGTNKEITCKTCISKMAISMANGKDYYREELHRALDIKPHTETIDTDISELQMIKIQIVALNREIELNGDIEVLSKREADELIEWLKTVSIEKHEQLQI